MRFKTPKKIWILFTALFVVGFFLLLGGRLVKAQIDCQNAGTNNISADDAQYCADQLQNLINVYLPAQNTNKKNLAALQSQLDDIDNRISVLSKQLQAVAADIKSRQEDIGFTQTIFDQKAKDQYTFLRLYDPVIPLLLSGSATQAFQEISLRQIAADSDRKTIDGYAQDLAKLNNDELTLQKTKDSLASSQKQVEAQTNFLAGEVAKVDAYLASLSAKQQSFIEAKQASLGLSRSAYNLNGGCSSDINPFKSPGFSPAIGFFTFGVPNRIGLNQYGAAGRANAGQSAQQILSAYYNADYSTGYNQSINIHVVGTNEYGQSINQTWQIDDYLKHLYEMPSSFPTEALKAQAIAARSFALAYTNNGSGTICPSQQCQVVKNESHGSDAWSQAVDATRGIVLTSGGQPIKAWFSATHGGYAYTSSDIGWSATPWTKRLVDASAPVSSFSDLMNNAYDKSSPVFYCDWGSRASNNGTAWLTGQEVADVANVALLAERDGSTKPHLYQVDKPNPEGTDTWDAGTVKSELSGKGGTPIDTATSVSVNVDFGTGRTTSVVVNGQTINGDDFKNYFDLRAPSNIQIVGPLYNVEIR